MVYLVFLEVKVKLAIPGQGDFPDRKVIADFLASVAVLVRCIITFVPLYELLIN